jgi:hypothetical protein
MTPLPFLGGKPNLGSKFLGEQHFWVVNIFGVSKYLGVKNCWWSKTLGDQNLWGVNKYVGSKKFGGQHLLGFKSGGFRVFACADREARTPLGVRHYLYMNPFWVYWSQKDGTSPSGRMTGSKKLHFLGPVPENLRRIFFICSYQCFGTF